MASATPDANPKLTFSLPWHRVGDADDRGFAILYGIIALSTVWVFESLVSKLLFCSEKYICITESASFLAFGGASWADLVRWYFPRRKGRNMFVLLAALLRVLVTLLDIVIIFLAVPRTIDVTESQIPNCMLNFNGTGNKLLPKPNSAIMEHNPCIWDKTAFDGFTPSSALLICSTSNSFEVDESPLSRPSGGDEWGFEVSYSPRGERLYFQVVPDGDKFFVTHNLFLPAQNGDPATTFSLPLPEDVDSQATKALANDPEFAQICSQAAVDTKRFECERSAANRSAELSELVIQAVMLNLYTTKTRTDRKKVLSNFEKDQVDRVIGSVNRPTLCVFPALILLGLLIAINLTVKYKFKTANICNKFYRLVVESIGDRSNINPLYANGKRLEFHRNEADMELGGTYLPPSVNPGSQAVVEVASEAPASEAKPSAEGVE